MDTAILAGGPADGRRMAVDAETGAVTVATAKPIPVVIAEPPEPPPWWQIVRWVRWRIARARWRPPPPPPPPEVIQLTYRADGSREDGMRVFRLGDDWQSYKGPEIADGGDLYGSLVGAYGAVHPMIRQDHRTRWVMDLGWYKQVRAIGVRHRDGKRNDPDGDDPEKWEPDPQDCLLGMQISVTGDGGRPHLENPHYPAGWPG